MKSPRYFTALLLHALLFLTGCASFNRIAEYPASAAPTTVSLVAKPMSKMSELPIGAYYDVNRHVIVAGHQKGLLLGMLLGPIGVIATDQANQSSARKEYGESTAQGSADLLSLAGDSLARLSAAGRAPHWKQAARDGTLRLSPYIIFTVNRETNLARMHAMLRAEILGADGKPTWSARYFARAPDEHPMAGAEGWTEKERFTAGAQAALDRVLGICMDDTHGKLTGTRKITAKGRYPYLNVDFELRALVVDENTDFVVVRLLVGDVMVMAGTHALDRGDYEIKAADFKDPR